VSWRRFFRRAHWDRERSAELRSYLEIETDDNIARGMPPDDARRAAHRKRGNTVRIREEIGIRHALGAEPLRVQQMFVRHGVTLTAIGIGAGLAGAVALTRLMSSLLYGIDPLDPATYLAVLVLLITSAALASYLPARRAATVNPMSSLATE
jgi:hypothetical protein